MNTRQVEEIVALAAGMDLPTVILGGDLNSTPDSEAIAVLQAAAFEDAWENAGPGDAGATWGHVVLREPEPSAFKQIDYVLVRGAVPIRAQLFLAEPRPDSAGQQLWASDHTGVMALVLPDGCEAGRSAESP